ncbi:hypothetical protein VNO77_26977 [Canavalia gladiata]|uniref:Uncharacterized protein n=1 Tax=Canavalia gladiata TaxID=3824 RepID=A0AAN9KUY7_CANGL
MTRLPFHLQVDPCSNDPRNFREQKKAFVLRKLMAKDNHNQDMVAALIRPQRSYSIAGGSNPATQILFNVLIWGSTYGYRGKAWFGLITLIGRGTQIAAPVINRIEGFMALWDLWQKAMSRRQESSADCETTDLMGEPNSLCKHYKPQLQGQEPVLFEEVSNLQLHRILNPQNVCKQFRNIFKQLASTITTTNAYDYLWLSMGSNRLLGFILHEPTPFGGIQTPTRYGFANHGAMPRKISYSSDQSFVYMPIN